ncbi:MAG: hypothetical protein ACOC56_05435, partial [Atribacterota bacterium]
PVTPWGVPTKGYKTRKNKYGGVMGDMDISLHLPENRAIIDDIGRKWLKKNRFKRNGSKNIFHKWVK